MGSGGWDRFVVGVVGGQARAWPRCGPVSASFLGNQGY